ncbi:hypothetical protein CBR_g39803 [Chara braunii]|uniref:CCHC-type domain-containing protein n=1 Tax=Chara braunii TaxID=69332 RepID=A0A388LSE9_CHABU|nr:hypothetical protein CBR_g39803 [Chara braunii]|eukprot:GBG85237.1 hypothetical protein CBR_g39803 [Chara braunii]
MYDRKMGIWRGEGDMERRRRMWTRRTTRRSRDGGGKEMDGRKRGREGGGGDMDSEEGENTRKGRRRGGMEDEEIRGAGGDKEDEEGQEEDEQEDDESEETKRRRKENTWKMRKGRRSKIGSGQAYGGTIGYAGGGGRMGGGNNACFNCGKLGHMARDCWSRQGRNMGGLQGDPELEEIKEEFRLAHKEKTEQEEKRRKEEEKRIREEEETRRNLDFARKAEEFKLQLRDELLEEWRKNHADAVKSTEKIGKSAKKTEKKKKKKKKRYRKEHGRPKRQRARRSRGRDDSSEDSESSCSTDDESNTSDDTSSGSESGGKITRDKIYFNLPKHEAHVLTSFADLDLPGFVKNARNITRPAKANSVEMIARAIVKACKHLKGVSIPAAVDLEEVWSDRREETAAWTDSEVIEWGNRFKGLVMTPIDRNQGDTAVMCPILYRHGFGKTFAWEANYELIGGLDLEIDIVKETREDFHRHHLDTIGKWRVDVRLGAAYVILKHKELTRWRPIAPAPVGPAALAQKRVAKALHCLLKRLSENSTFYLNSISELSGQLSAMTVRMRATGCERAVGRCYDIKDMFFRIPHDAVKDAVLQLLRKYEDEGVK